MSDAESGMRVQRVIDDPKAPATSRDPLLHLPSDVRSYVYALREAVVGVLGGEEVIQIFLIGSASYASGFIAGKSDIDVAVVTRSDLKEPSLRRVPEGCSHSVLPCPAEKLELVVYAYDAVHLDSPPDTYRVSLNFNTGQSMPNDHVRYGNNPDDSPHWFVLDVAAAHTNNVPLIPSGPSFGDIFTPRLGRSQVIDALLTSLQWHIENEPTSPNAVLNACRGWKWAEEGVFASKLSGGEFALERLDTRSADVVRHAMDTRTGITRTSSPPLPPGDLYKRISMGIQNASVECSDTTIMS